MNIKNHGGKHTEDKKKKTSLRDTPTWSSGVPLQVCISKMRPLNHLEKGEMTLPAPYSTRLLLDLRQAVGRYFKFDPFLLQLQLSYPTVPGMYKLPNFMDSFLN